MKYFKLWYLLFGLSLYQSVSADEAKIISCDGQYALCTSAQCIPDPRNPKYAICTCTVHTGNSMGFSSCQFRKPVTYQDNVIHLISTFSLNDYPAKKSMQCKSGASWSNCLDQPCTINPLNPQQAICSCPIINNGEFVTFGGDCNTDTCNTGFWSAALVSQSNELLKLISKTTNNMPTMQELMCPLKNK